MEKNRTVRSFVARKTNCEQNIGDDLPQEVIFTLSRACGRWNDSTGHTGMTYAAADIVQWMVNEKHAIIKDHLN